MKTTTLVVLAALTGTLLGPQTALAGPVDLTPVIKGLDGKDIIGSDGKAIVMTMETAVTNALLSAPAANEEEKGQNFKLAIRVMGLAKSYTATPDEIVRIRKALAATQPTLFFGTVMNAIDPTFSPAPAPVPAPVPPPAKK